MAKIIVNGEKVIEIGALTTIGRASDNHLSLADDSNVSRYHAEIERRDGDFWLIELGSSNGTTVNGKDLRNETLLRDGDIIVFGNSAKVEFQQPENVMTETAVEASNPEPLNQSPNPQTENPSASDSSKKSKLPLILGIAALTSALAVISVFAVVFFLMKEADCQASAKIVSPDNEETIEEPTEILVETINGECVQRAFILLNGEEIAVLDSQPFSLTVNPDDFPQLDDGGVYPIQIILEDKKGKRLSQSNQIVVAFQTKEVEAKPLPTIQETEIKETTQTPLPSPGNQKRQVSLAETQEMVRRLVNQFSGNFQYQFDPQFLQQVQLKTKEYAVDGYFERASQYRDVINVSFVQEQNLDAPLPYILAMSRSQFNSQKRNNEEGLWRMTNEFVTANSYNGLCSAESLSDSSQNCAAKSSALYLKALVLNIFEGDIVYAMACFGMSPTDASSFKLSLPPQRQDFWRVLKDPKKKEEVVRFFAAGIVAENPQKFGLKRDQPISSLYKNLIR